MFNFLKNWSRSKYDNTKEKTKKVTNFDEINKNKEDIVHLIHENLNPYNKKVARNETFENAYYRLGLDEETLEKVYYNHCLRFYLSALVGFVAIFLTGKYMIDGDYWTVLPAIACVSISIAQCINASFRCYQINRRELVSFSEWVESKKFIPILSYKKPELTKKRRRKVSSDESLASEENNESSKDKE